ncbi:MAG: A24 family peptidase [Thermofilaceae archaeon]
MIHGPLQAARAAVTLAILGYAAYSDIKSREVDDAVWLILVIASAALIFPELATFDRSQLILYFISVYVAFALGLALPTLGLMGDADFLAIACLGLATPPDWRASLSSIPSLSIFINALLASCLYPLALFARNLLLVMRGIELFEGVEISTAGKLLALFTMTKVPTRIYLSRRYAYTLTEIAEDGRRKIVFRARISEAPQQPQGEWVWVSPYIPFVAMLTVGYAIHTFYGCILELLFAP